MVFGRAAVRIAAAMIRTAATPDWVHGRPMSRIRRQWQSKPRNLVIGWFLVKSPGTESPPFAPRRVAAKYQARAAERQAVRGKAIQNNLARRQSLV
jgi:hypothetical protein